MSKFVINVSIEVDTDKLIENLKQRGIVKPDGSINGVDAHDYVKGYVSGGLTVKMDTTDLLKEIIADLDKKLHTKDLFKHF